MADVIVLAAIGLAIFFIVRAYKKGGGECASCGSAGSCEAHTLGTGHCSAAEDMLSHVSSALDKKTESR